MKRLTSTIAALGGSLCLCGPALADPSSGPVVVTASRLSQPLAITPSATIIGRDQIESRGSAFAADLLATVPGVIIGEFEKLAAEFDLESYDGMDVGPVLKQ